MRAVTTRESCFTQEDVGELTALAIYRDSLCPKCGRPLEVCTADEGKPGTAQFDVVWRTCNATRRLAEFKAATYTDKNHPYREAHLLGTSIRER